MGLHGCKACLVRVQAAFGRQSLSISSIFVYVALVTGLLGNTLSIPFALYVFIVQRDVADNIQVGLASAQILLVSCLQAACTLRQPKSSQASARN